MAWFGAGRVVDWEKLMSPTLMKQFGIDPVNTAMKLRIPDSCAVGFIVPVATPTKGVVHTEFAKEQAEGTEEHPRIFATKRRPASSLQVSPFVGGFAPYSTEQQVRDFAVLNKTGTKYLRRCPGGPNLEQAMDHFVSTDILLCAGNLSLP
jgi:hypothetical protein